MTKNALIFIKEINIVQGDMLADIGGYLGMFLGWSFLSIAVKFYKKFSDLRNVVRDLCRKDSEWNKDMILD